MNTLKLTSNPYMSATQSKKRFKEESLENKKCPGVSKKKSCHTETKNKPKLTQLYSKTVAKETLLTPSLNSPNCENLKDSKNPSQFSRNSPTVTPPHRLFLNSNQNMSKRPKCPIGTNSSYLQIVWMTEPCRQLKYHKYLFLLRLGSKGLSLIQIEHDYQQK